MAGLAGARRFLGRPSSAEGGLGLASRRRGRRARGAGTCRVPGTRRRPLGRGRAPRRARPSLAPPAGRAARGEAPPSGRRWPRPPLAPPPAPRLRRRAGPLERAGRGGAGRAGSRARSGDPLPRAPGCRRARRVRPGARAGGAVGGAAPCAAVRAVPAAAEAAASPSPSPCARCRSRKGGMKYTGFPPVPNPVAKLKSLPLLEEGRLDNGGN